MGKPKWHYFKALNRNVSYRVFEKEIGSFAPLVPINHLDKDEGPMEYPFGAVEFYFNRSDPLKPDSKLVSMESSDNNYHTIDGIAFLQLPDLPEVSLKHIAHDSNYFLYPSFFLVITDMTNFYQTNQGFTFFTKPVFLSQYDEYEPLKYDNKFKKIYGVFCYQQRLYIMAIANNSEEAKIYQASYVDPLPAIDYNRLGPDLHYLFPPDEILVRILRV